MSSVDNRVVQMKFDNRQFESGVKTTINSLDKLKNSLNIDSAARSLSKLEGYGRTLSVSVSSSVDGISDRLSALGVIGSTVLSNLTTSAMNMASKISKMVISPIISGGKSRALNIEQAKFQLEGLGIAWEDIEEDISYGVQDTAYGLDSAAKAASQLTASGVKLGDEMKSSLRGISGVAAMTNSSYDDIARIFTTVAGNGRLMSDQLNQLGSRGLNAAATLAKALGVTEQEVREMTSKGQIDFKTFSDAMDSAYGEHAKDANKTFTGSLSNMKAALSRIGAKFATPAFENLKNVMNALIPVINAINKGLDPLVEIATKGMEKISVFAAETLGSLGLVGKAAKKEAKNLEKVQSFDMLIEVIGNFINSLKNAGANVLKILKTINKAFKEVFPPTTLEKVDAFMKKMAKLTSNFKITNDTTEKLQNCFKGFFSILDIGKGVILAVKKILFSLIDNVSGFGDKILDTAANFGNYIFKIDKAAKKNDTFYNSLKKIIDYVKVKIPSVIPNIKEFYSSFLEFIKPLTNALENSKNSLTDFFENGLSAENLKTIIIIANIFKTLIESVLNVGTAIIKIAKPISEALFEMFPIIQLETIQSFVKNLSKFTEKLKVSDETAEKIKGTFKGLFSAADIVKQVFSALLRTIFPTTKHFGKLGEGILTVTSFLGNHLYELDRTIKENDTFYTVLQNVIETIKKGFHTAKEKVAELIEAFEKLTGINLKTKAFEIFSAVSEKIKTIVSDFPSVFTNAKDSVLEFFKSFIFGDAESMKKQVSVFGAISKIFEFMSDVLSTVSPDIKSSLSDVSTSFENTFTKIDIDRLLKILNIGTFGGVIMALKKLRGVLSSIFSYGRVFHNFNGLIVGAKNSLTALTNDIKVNTITKIAGAIAILTASVIALSMVKEEKLRGALHAIESLFMELFASLFIMTVFIDGDKFSGNIRKLTFSLILIATAISILASAVKKLGKLDTAQLIKGVIGLAAIMFGLYAFLEASKFENISIKKGAGLILIAIALNLMTTTIKKFGKIDVDKLIKGLLGIAVLLAEIVAFTNFVGSPTKLVSTGLGLIVVSTALLIFSKAVGILGRMSIADLAKGLIGMAVALTEIIFALSFMPTTLPILSVGLITVAVALNLIALAMKTMGKMSWDAVAKSLLTLTVSLAAITVAMTFMKGALPGATALLVIAASLTVLAPILMMFGKLSLAEIGKGLLMLAGIFAVIGAASALLSPVIPSMLSLAGAIVLIGIGLLAAGAGLAVAATGIAALLGLTAEFTAFVKLIGDLGVVLIVSIGNVVMALLSYVGEILPLLWNVALNIIVTVFKGIADNIGIIVESGVLIIVNLLRGLGSHIDEVVVAAVTIILKFVDGIAVMMPAIVESGINLIVCFIDGIADGIRNNTDKVLSAVKNLMSSIVEFALSTLQDLVKNIPMVGEEMYNGLEEAKSLVRNTLAPEEMKKIGHDAASATADGIKSGNNDAKNAGSGLGKFAKNGLSSILGEFGSIGSNFGTDFSASLGGTNEEASSAGMNLGESAKNGLNSALPDFGSLGSSFGTDFSLSLGDTNNLASDAAMGVGASASNGLNIDFSNIGAESGDTYASGLLNSKEDVKKSTQSLTSTATKNLDDANSKFKKSGSENGISYALGISSEKKRASNAGRDIAAKGNESIRSKQGDFRGAGINLGKGFAYGLSDTKLEVSNAASGIAGEALRAMRETLDINSPSKEAYDIGEYTDEGVALGLKKHMKVVANASKAVGENTKKSLRNSLMRVSSVLADDLNVNPTIRPVMDLSDITYGAQQINGLFSKRDIDIGNINARITDRNMQMLSDIVSDMQNSNVFDSSDIIRSINELRSDVAYLGNAISNMQIKMDTGALVGSMVVPMDEALGRRMTHRGRNN